MTDTDIVMNEDKTTSKQTNIQHIENKNHCITYLIVKYQKYQYYK
jgi:hypothetical protein